LRDDDLIVDASHTRFKTRDRLGEFPVVDGCRRSTKRQSSVLSKGKLCPANATLQGAEVHPQAGADLGVRNG
jgi:hypothetical protein